MATVIEAAGNLAFSLIAISIRDVYLQRLDLFRAIVARPRGAGVHGRGGRDRSRRSRGAREAMTALAGAQERRLLEALG